VLRLLSSALWAQVYRLYIEEIHSVQTLTEGYVGSLHENRHGSSVQIRRRKASGDPYWAYSGDFTMYSLLLTSLQTPSAHILSFLAFLPFTCRICLITLLLLSVFF
uniref:Uncharacterized protein n=1 Tax=Accipiter nisus TaxID=211598 RepID=A0A8B9M217_9AVES